MAVEITDLLNAQFIAYILFIAVVAMVINWIDPQVTIIKTWQAFIVSLIGSILAAFLVGWGQLDVGADIYSLVGFGMVVFGSLGGFVTVRAALHAPTTIPQIANPPKP